MKKILSIVITGAVIISFSACSASSKPSDTSVETTTETTTEATTTTTEETTTEATTTEETEPGFDDLIPSDGEIFVDFGVKNSSQVSENVLKTMRIRTNTTAESYANRFSIKPEYSYSKGVWTFKWGKDKPKTNTFGTITIKAKNEDGKIVLEEKSSVTVTLLFDETDFSRGVYEQVGNSIVPDGDSSDYLKDGLAINPRNSWKNMSFQVNYQKYTFKGVVATFTCSVKVPSDSENE